MSVRAQYLSQVSGRTSSRQGDHLVFLALQANEKVQSWISLAGGCKQWGKYADLWKRDNVASGL